jgi:hypothetical protein
MISEMGHSPLTSSTSTTRSTDMPSKAKAERHAKYFTFYVAQHHIDAGVCGSPTKCMTALAIREANPNVSHVAVRTNEICTTEWGTTGRPLYKRHHVPTPVARKIHHHDTPGERHLIKPFTATISVVESKGAPVVTPEQRARTKLLREQRRANGLPTRPRAAAKRINGI